MKREQMTSEGIAGPFKGNNRWRRAVALTAVAAAMQPAAADLLDFQRPSAGEIPTVLSGPEVLPVAEAFRLETEPAGPGALRVRFDVQSGYYLYRDKIRARAIEAEASHASTHHVRVEGLPKGEQFVDPVFGEVAVFPMPVEFTIESASTDPIEIELSYQGCAEAGVCYQPQKVQLWVEGVAP